MERIWDSLDQYRGKIFEGTWPSIPVMFSISVMNHGQNKAFTSLGKTTKTFTYAEADAEIRRISAYFQSLGIKKGDRIVIHGKNTPAWALAYLATLFCGAVVVPLDSQMPSERVSQLGAFAGATIVCIDTDLLEKLHRDSWFDQLQAVIVLDESPDESYECIWSVRSSTAYREIITVEDDLAAILFTSGTTGNEKGVMLTHGNFTSDVYQAGDPEFLSITSGDVFYALLPLHHSYSMTAVFLESLMHGCELIFGSQMAVAKILSDMREGHVTLFLAIPLIFNKLLAGLFKKVREKGLFTYILVHIMLFINGIARKVFKKNPGRKWFKTMLEGIGMYNIKLCICGGGPLSPKVFKRYQQLGIDFIQGYGLTETAPILTLNPVSHFKVTSVGKVFPLITMRIANPDLFGVGEVQVKGPNICKGYYHDPENTKELFTEDGFLRTGDLGSMDKEQYLYLKGRAKNIIVTEGGKNVYPEEIEDSFQLYPQIEQILVRPYVAKKSERAEGIEAVIYPNQDYYKQKNLNQANIEEDVGKVVAEVNRKLVSYKKISRITILDKPMAMTSTRKIQRGKVGRTIGRLLNGF